MLDSWVGHGIYTTRIIDVSKLLNLISAVANYGGWPLGRPPSAASL